MLQTAPLFCHNVKSKAKGVWMLSGVYLTSHALWCRPDEERNSLIVQFNTNENVHNAVKTSIKAIRSEDTFQKGEPRLK